MENNTIENLLKLYDLEISKNVRNKKRLMQFERHKMENIISIQKDIDNIDYKIKHYNIFLIFEPKSRVIMSMNIHDKMINHFFTRNVLMPKLEKYLDLRNVATRKNMGTDYGIKLIKKYINCLKKYEGFYVLKLDIKKYFYSISHEKLKKMLKKDLMEKEYTIICSIIDSTNESYINKTIDKLSKGKLLPHYAYGHGLPIGNLTSQFLSIYFLHELDHYIVHTLKLKYYVRYMDDFIIMHKDKDYLKVCLEKIIYKLKNDFDLEINKKKTHITHIKEGFIFLGYKFFLKNKKTICIVRNETYQKIKHKVKKNKKDFENGKICLEQYFSSLSNYYNAYYGSKIKIRNYIDSLL